MKRRLLALLQAFANVQARLMLTLFFFLVLTPYALVLRCCRHSFLPRGGCWQSVDHAKATLSSLRRSF